MKKHHKENKEETRREEKNDSGSCVSPGRYIAMLRRQMIGFFDREMQPLGLGRGNYEIILFLLHNELVRQEELCRHLYKDKGTIARGVARLEEDGFVERCTDPEDQRARQVRLTQKGRDIVPELRKVLKKGSDILTAGFTEEEKEGVLDLLKRMNDNMCEYRHEQHRHHKGTHHCKHHKGCRRHGEKAEGDEGGKPDRKKRHHHHNRKPESGPEVEPQAKPEKEEL